METFQPNDWLENFRMSRERFACLCDKLRPVIACQDTYFCKCISTEKRVAVTLWCLATPTEYRTLAHLFGIARSTVCMIVHNTCKAIVDVLIKEYIRFPVGQDLKDVVSGFENKWGFPQCAGAIDGSHIPISAPELNHTDYFNRKGWYSMLVQAVVDHEYLLRDICVGWPGSVHDARVFVNSLLYKRITEDNILDSSGRTILGRNIPICIVGDSAYPIQPWLMKPFTDDSTLTHQQKHFNYRLSRARIVAECAFGHLKARWRRLSKRNDMITDHIPTIITATCILHNICEIHHEHFNENWLQVNTDSQQPSRPSSSTSSPMSSESDVIRNTLMTYLYSQQQ